MKITQNHVGKYIVLPINSQLQEIFRIIFAGEHLFVVSDISSGEEFSYSNLEQESYFIFDNLMQSVYDEVSN